MEIGSKIKRLRVRLGLTQEELAARTELTKGFISQLERDITSPSIATLMDILEALGTNVSEFFSDRDHAPAQIHGPVHDPVRKDRPGCPDAEPLDVTLPDTEGFQLLVHRFRNVGQNPGAIVRRVRLHLPLLLHLPVCRENAQFACGSAEIGADYVLSFTHFPPAFLYYS